MLKPKPRRWVTWAIEGSEMSLRQLASVPRTEEEEKLETYRKRMQIRKIRMYVGPDQLVTFVRFSQSAVDCLRDLLRERCREPKA